MVNTEFYSWDTSFGLVNPLLGFSCEQVVFCVNLDTFLKCFLQLGWRLTGVRSTHTESSLNVPWDTSFGLVNHCLGYSCGQVVFCVKLGPFFEVLLAVGMGAHGRPLNST